MSEYTLDTSIHKLIGTPGGYVGHKDPYIFFKLKENPYRIILVDELEKANPKVWNLFLQIMDEGFITDSCGEKIRFDKTMIFMTSNLEVKEKDGRHADSGKNRSHSSVYRNRCSNLGTGKLVAWMYQSAAFHYYLVFHLAFCQY